MAPVVFPSSQLAAVRMTFLDVLSQRALKLTESPAGVQPQPPHLQSVSAPAAPPLWTARNPPDTVVPRLVATIGESGLLIDGALKTLSAAEGKLFLTVLAQNLPPGWDPIDTLATFNRRFQETDRRYRRGQFDFYGPWQPDGEKDVNASLRCLGMHEERWGGNKELTLIHPYGNRANPVIQAAELLQRGRDIIDILSKSIPWPLALPRLEVESFLMDLYGERSDWQERLRPELDPEARRSHFASILTENERLKGALRVLDDYFRRR